MIFLFLRPLPGLGLGQDKYVENVYHHGDFAVAQKNAAATLVVDSREFPGVVRAVHDLQSDLQRVTGCIAAISLQGPQAGSHAILIGTIGNSEIVDGLVRAHKLDVDSIRGKWEAFLIQVVANPAPGVDGALVIAGSDKRGTIFGIYDLSEQIGVSPWYWWADVPVRHQDALYVMSGNHGDGPPAVKYRGIFLNDEAPALTGWVKEKYGSYDHKFYEKVFELILRLKGNYLWPAMWGSAFSEDDPLNPKIADEWGIVMGTTHHEPMLRAQQEWKRHGAGPWDYSKNSDVLRKFWQGGVESNKKYENIITLGMRGDGDMPMTESANIALLEKIVADQRKIVAERVNPNLSEVPQDWALYKEVQEYYEKGMRVPDDVTLLWCDDNWGNIRRLPTAEERKRSGGAGIYYHFDYVGDPRNYKWINTNPISKVWEQMDTAYRYGADRIWIVNVGDLKPMEFPIEYFLNLAWNPDRWPKERISKFTNLWATREFGPEHAAEIADIVAKYTKYNGRRKPELLEPTTFSVVNYQEAERVVEDFRSIVEKAEAIQGTLPEDERDAFFELVLHPAKAAATVTSLYVAAGKNRLYASQGRASANDWAVEVRKLFQADADLSAYYNHTLANGKWNHMMDQTHIGYTYWQEPAVNSMPEVKEVLLSSGGKIGVAVEGSTSAWPGAREMASLPPFDALAQQRRYLDVFNRGGAGFSFAANVSAPWIVLSEQRGTVEKERRVWVTVNWDKAPPGTATGTITISGAGADVAVNLTAFRPQQPTRASLEGFAEGDGYVSIEAAHYTDKTDGNSARWEEVPDLGRTLSAMTVFPVTAQSVTPPQNSPRLNYRMYIFRPGQVEVQAILDPTQNYVPGRGLRYGISFDDEPPQIIDTLAHNSRQDWETTVKDSVRMDISAHTVAKPGYHTLKFWMVDPGVVLQKLVVNLGGVRPSYLGPPESYRGKQDAPSR